MKRDTAWQPARSRRTFLKDAATLLGIGAAAQLPGGRAWAQALSQPAQAPKKGSTVVLLGTQGGPSINLRRNETASALIVDGVPYLVDCGYGTLKALVRSGIGYIDLATIFLTHLHDDHTADIAALLTHQWTGRRTKPTDLYGPYGTAALVKGALEFFKANTEIRIVDEGRTVRPETLFHGHDLPATAKPKKAYEDARIRVMTAENTHFPERAKAKMPYRSLAYRFDTAYRSIVFAGDTAYSKNVVGLARNADVFICEAMDVAQHDRLVQRAKRAAETGASDAMILRHVVDTHSTTEVVGRMAAEANVKLVVLNHLLPGSNGPLSREVPDTTYIAGVHKYYHGEVIVGRDYMRI